jgi:hypothetical protein
MTNVESPRSDLGSLATAKKTICIPSSKPITDMSTKKRITETPSRTPFHIVSSLALKESSSQGHHKAKARMPMVHTSAPHIIH